MELFLTLKLYLHKTELFNIEVLTFNRVNEICTYTKLNELH